MAYLLNDINFKTVADPCIQVEFLCHFHYSFSIYMATKP